MDIHSPNMAISTMKLDVFFGMVYFQGRTLKLQVLWKGAFLIGSDVNCLSDLLENRIICESKICVTDFFNISPKPCHGTYVPLKNVKEL